MAIDKRDGHGRFAQGHGGGPGRPRRAVEADYLRSLADAVSAEDWTEIVFPAVEDAKGGDRAAREWLGSYLIGRAVTDAPSLKRAQDPEAEERDDIFRGLEALARTPAVPPGLSAVPRRTVLEEIAAMGD